MVTFTNTAALLWRDFIVDETPSSGTFNPIKGDIRTWGGEVETSLNALESFLDGTSDITNISITGGSLDGAVIGANSPAAGTFTTGTINTAIITTGTITDLTVTGTVSISGFTIGTEIQAWDASLDSIALLGSGADKFIYTTGEDIWAEADVTATGRGILASASESVVRANISSGDLVETQAADYTAVVTSRSNLQVCSASLTLTLPPVATAGDGFRLPVYAYGGNVTIQPDETETINGKSFYFIRKGGSCQLFCDGIEWFIPEQDQSAKAHAWVVFSWDGTTTSILSSFNVASVVKNGNGDYTITFSSICPTANPAIAGTASTLYTPVSASRAGIVSVLATSVLTARVGIINNDSDVVSDRDYCSVVIYG